MKTLAYDSHRGETWTDAAGSTPSGSGPPCYTPEEEPSSPTEYLDPSSSSDSRLSVALSSQSDASPPTEIIHRRRTSGDTPQVVPPGYFPPRSLGARMYEFTPESFNSMKLVSRDRLSPDYYITVQMNCFIPSSFITTIRRESADGYVVGSFEMGMSTKPGTATVLNTEKLLSTVLVKVGSKADKVWQWRWHENEDLHLSWYGQMPRMYCYPRSQTGIPGASLLATFEPQPMAPKADGSPSPPASLKLFPEGQPLFEHILLSALVLERQRLTPVLSSRERSWFW